MEFRVPIEQVKGHRFLAEHVVVDHIGPDQVVGAQQVEGVRHARTREIAFLLHALFNPLHLLFIHIDAQVASLFEINLGREKSRGIDAVVILGCHVAKGRRNQVPPMQ